jgi:FtsP/CotA-like multicopper oxidase with cupredoxin domain
MGMMRGPMMGRRQGLADGPLTEPWYDGYAVNGRVFPQVEPLKVKPGDLVRLRLINASSSTIFDLALAGHAPTVTHLDGQPIRPVRTEVVRIGMGERYDLEFVADNPGAWLLAANELGYGESGLMVPLVYGSSRDKSPVRPVFKPGMVLARYWDMETLEPGERGSGGDWRGFRQILGGGMHSPFWTINGRVHPDSERLVVETGETIRLGYLNRSPMAHPMHLHGHFFRLVNRDLDRERWLFKDTVVVEPMEGLEVELLADNSGRWFHHCHNLYHMEAGMANVMAYRLRSSLRRGNKEKT